MTDGLTLGGGKLYIERYNTDGSLTKKRYFGITDDITFNTKIDYVEHKNTEESEERIDFKGIKSKSASLKFTTSQITPEMLALALAGNSNDISQGSGSVSDEEHDAVEGGTFVDLAKYKVSNVVVKYKDGDDDKTAVEGTDYRVDYSKGMLEIIAGGAIDGKDIKVDYDYAKTTIYSIKALVQKMITARLTFDSNPQNGQEARYIFHKVQLSSSGDIKLKDTNNFITVSFEGEVLATDNKENPYLEVVTLG